METYDSLLIPVTLLMIYYQSNLQSHQRFQFLYNFEILRKANLLTFNMPAAGQIIFLLNVKEKCRSANVEDGSAYQVAILED